MLSPAGMQRSCASATQGSRRRSGCAAESSRRRHSRLAGVNRCGSMRSAKVTRSLSPRRSLDGARRESENLRSSWPLAAHRLLSAFGRRHQGRWSSVSPPQRLCRSVLARRRGVQACSASAGAGFRSLTSAAMRFRSQLSIWLFAPTRRLTAQTFVRSFWTCANSRCRRARQWHICGAVCWTFAKRWLAVALCF